MNVPTLSDATGREADLEAEIHRCVGPLVAERRGMAVSGT